MRNNICIYIKIRVGNYDLCAALDLMDWKPVSIIQITETAPGSQVLYMTYVSFSLSIGDSAASSEEYCLSHWKKLKTIETKKSSNKTKRMKANRAESPLLRAFKKLDNKKKAKVMKKQEQNVSIMNFVKTSEKQHSEEEFNRQRFAIKIFLVEKATIVKCFVLEFSIQLCINACTERRVNM